MLELRGVECKAFTELKLASSKNKRSIILDTNNWNPVHFATFFKQKKVLEYFVDIFDGAIDIRYAMKYKEADLNSYEGATYKKKDKHRSLQKKIIEGLLGEHFALYGFLIAIFTQNVGIFQFLCSAEGPCTPGLNNILILVQIC